MNYSQWMDSKVKNFKWQDIALTKWSAAAFTLMIAKLWPPILALDWYWYLVISLLLAIKPMKTMCCK